MMKKREMGKDPLIEGPQKAPSHEPKRRRTVAPCLPVVAPEELKDLVVAELREKDSGRHMDKAYLHLRDAHMVLIADKAYRFRHNRIGASASENDWDDPAHRPEPIECIEQFRQAVGNGVVPNPNLLIYVANCFAKYIEANKQSVTSGADKIDLNQAFGVVSKHKSGNPAQQLARQRRDEEYLYLMAEYRGKDQNASVRTAAEKVYDLPRRTPAENDAAEKSFARMERAFHESGWAKIEKQMGGRLVLTPFQS